MKESPPHFVQPDNQLMLGMSKKKLAIVAGIFLLIGVAMGYAFNYFFLKNPKYLYLQAEAKNYERIVASWEEKYAQEWALQKEMLQRPSSRKMELSGNFAFQGLLGSFINQQLAVVQEGLEQTSLTITVEQDPQKRNYLTSASVVLHGADLFTAELLQSSELTALRLPQAYSTYLYLPNEQLGQWLRSLYPAYVGPDNMPSPADAAVITQLSEQPQEAKDALKKKYGKFLFSQLENHMFTMEKIAYSTPDGEIKAREITLRMTEQEVNDIIQGVSQLIKEDEEILDTLLDTSLVRLVQGLEELTFPDGLTLTAILDHKGNVVEREVDVQLAHRQTQAGVHVLYTSSRSISREIENQSWKVEIEPTVSMEIGKAVLQVERLSTAADRGLPSKTDGQVQILAADSEGLVINLALDTLREQGKQDGARVIDSQFSISLGGSWLEYTPLTAVTGIRGQIKQEIEQNLEENYAQKDVASALYIDVNSRLTGKQSLGVRLQLNDEIEFTDELFFPMIEGEEAVNISTMATEEWWNLVSQINTSFGHVLDRVIKGAQR